MLPSLEKLHQSIDGQPRRDRFLICGLGSLGQHCVAVLSHLDISISVIDKIQPNHWEIPDLPDLINTLIVGDCRQERVLEHFLKRRPPIPQRDHTVVVGLGRVGQRVAAQLQFCEPLVGMTTTELEPNVLPQLPLIVGNITTALQKANLATAKSVVIVTDDEMVNVEVALMARAANPRASLVIRTYEQRLTDRLTQLLPESQVLCAYALAAEVFTAAAFGENVKSLFRLNQQTVLVTEYQIEADERLNGCLLAEVAYGYGVVPVLHQKPRESAELMPSDTIRLAVGDRLVVLATINSLKKIEQGEMAPRLWLVRVSKPLVQAEFDGANAIALVSGCNMSIAHNLMTDLPGILKMPLYKHQAQRLVRDLSKLGIQSHLVSISKNKGDKG